MFDLHKYQWKYRVLILFAPASVHADYREQITHFIGYRAGMAERDMMVMHVFTGETSRAETLALDAESAAALREQFAVPPQRFTLVLIGRDGTEKFRSDAPTPITEIFSVIDQMPMRREEMERP